MDKRRKSDRHDSLIFRLRDAAPITLALIILTGFFFAVIFMLNRPFPIENKDTITAAFEVLKNILIMVISYYFGSSAANRTKDETISDIALRPVAPIAPVAVVTPVAPIAPIAPIATPTPINIQNADSVEVKTDKGDVTVNQKPEDV